MSAKSRPSSIAAALSRKAVEATDPRPTRERETGAIRTLTLRLPDAVHDQLREMSYVQRRSQHALLMEALNLLFERDGKPPIAPIPA